MKRKVNIWKVGGLIALLVGLAACQTGPAPRVYRPRTPAAGTTLAPLYSPEATALASADTPMPTADNLPSTATLPPVSAALAVTETPAAIAATGEEAQDLYLPLLVTAEIAFPPLNPARAYMVYYGETNGQPEVVLLNADLRGRRALPLPADSLPPRLPEALSPGGQWLAFHTAAPDEALHLMNLPNGRMTRVDSLPVPDALRWSPTGRYLAFTSGGERGAQTEVLMYDRWRDAVYRLGGGDAPVLWLRWSPDNNHVLYAAAAAGCDGDCGHWTVVDVRNGRSWQPQLGLQDGEQVMMMGWKDPRVVAIVVRSAEHSALKTFNIASSSQTTALDVPFDAYAFDADNNMYALSVEEAGALEPGIYLYAPSAGEPKLVARFADYGKLRVKTFGRRGISFLLWNDAQIFTMGARGAVEAAAQGALAAVSPHNNWLAVMDPTATSPALLLLNNRFQVAHTLPGEYVGELFWSEDETVLFSVLGNRLYALPLATLEWALVDGQLPESSAIWDEAFLYAWR